MKITALTENIRGNEKVEPEHGLSLYIETEKHTVLFDTGASGVFLKNAAALGKNMSAVDTVVISHGHYDHGGGIERFIQVNKTAPVYINKDAFEDIYRIAVGGVKYIGLDKRISGEDSIVKLDGNIIIDEELSIFTGVKERKLWPSGNRKMRIKENGIFRNDEFLHEQNLVVNNKKTVLFAGCSHNGAVNIAEEFIRLYGKPADVFVGGFHFKRDGDYTESDLELIRNTAKYFKRFPTMFYTCHCTGVEPYEEMKKIMGEQLEYIKCGDEIEI